MRELAVLEVKLVVRLQAFQAHAQALGNGFGALAPLDGMGLPAVPVARLEIAFEGVGATGGHQQADRRIGADHFPRERGVQGQEFIVADAGEPGGRLHIHAGVYGDLVEIGFVGQGGQRDAEAFG